MLLIVLLFQWGINPALSIAEQGIFLPISSAKQLIVDRRMDKANLAYCFSNLSSVTQQRTLLQLSEKIKDQKILNLTANNTDRQGQIDILKPNYLACTNDLQVCNDSKPSKLVWGSIGFGIATILGILGLFMIKK